MPDTDPWTGAPLPLDGEADDVPASLSAYNDVTRNLLVLRATDAADRDARFGDAPAGMLCSSTAGDFLWRKLVGSGWQTLVRPVRTSTVQLTSDWTASTNAIRLSGHGVGLVYLTLQYQGADVGPSASGDIGNVRVGTAPDSAFFPAGFAASLQGGPSGPLVQGYLSNVDGSVWLSAIPPSTYVLTSGNTVQLIGMFEEQL